MKTIRLLLFIAISITCIVPTAKAEDLVLASGGGYKKMVNALNAAYQKKTGQKLALIYGNMGRVTTLARESGKVGLVLGDETFLTNAKLPMAKTLEIGHGKLVLAFAKSSPFSRLADLDAPDAQRIALPNTNKAIYGKAARQFLTSSGRLPTIKPKLVEVSTIPQVFSYLNTNEVDMGFINLTHALNVKDQIGTYMVIENGYSPIRIIVGLLETCSDRNQAEQFINFLQTPEAMTIIEANGL